MSEKSIAHSRRVRSAAAGAVLALGLAVGGTGIASAEPETVCTPSADPLVTCAEEEAAATTDADAATSTETTPEKVEAGVAGAGSAETAGTDAAALAEAEA
ncbi:MAG: hypothetical protein L0H03_08545, partial [Rhodococcus sp. (in: high G+C Gram-positive bacteria)]|nr:hypothetical protein [Rhodococcus sp. (in: high G+C Gram-positive bacteria)]